MTIVSRTYRLFLGLTGFFSAELIGSTVLLVKREGLGYDRNNDAPAAPGSREFQHDSPNGTIRFLNEGAGGEETSPGGAVDTSERVLVIFKYN